MRTPLLISLTLLFLQAGLAHAQDIYGTILVETPNGVVTAPGATVKARWGENEASATTNKDGIYQLKCAAGDCAITVVFDNKESMVLKIQVPAEGVGVTLQLHPVNGRWFPIRK